MTSGSCERLSELPDAALGLIEESRRAILATVDLKTRPHAVPVCFAVRGNEIVSAIDDKPKGRRRLARVVNLEANPSATILFDRWAEDWTRLG